MFVWIATRTGVQLPSPPNYQPDPKRHYLPPVRAFDFAGGVLLPLLVTEPELVRAALSEVGGLVNYGGVGSAVPDFDWTSPMSELLIAPSTVTS